MFPDMLTGKMVKALMHLQKSCPLTPARQRKLPGVKCILTARDFEWKSLVGNGEFAAEFADKEVLCSEKVRQVGDDVAAVAAVDEETAQRAADLIKVEYQVLPGGCLTPLRQWRRMPPR